MGVRVLLVACLVLVALLLVVQWRAGDREAAAERSYPPTGRLIDIDGVHVNVEVRGPDDGSLPDLVLIHGASGNLRDFTFDLADRLTPHYRVILMDRPGLGWTDRLPGNAGAWNGTAETPMEQARLLQRAAERVGVTRPIVLGHSFGGAVAIAWALSRPDQTAALVLVSAVSEPWPGGLGALYKITGSTAGGALFIPLVTAFLPQRFVASSIGAIFAPQEAPAGYADHIGSGLTLRRESMRANAQQVTGLKPHMIAMRRDYDRLTMPVELVHGTADTIVPARIHAEVFTRDVPQARLTLLPGLGHMPQHIDPQAVVDAIHRAAARAGLR